MNEIASLPWYIRHQIFPTLFGMVGIANGLGWWSIVAYAATFVVECCMQAGIDGWNPNKW